MLIWIGGFSGNDYSLTLDGSNLIYSARVDDDTNEQIISATKEDWNAFRSEIDAIGISNWHADYDNYDAKTKQQGKANAAGAVLRSGGGDSRAGADVLLRGRGGGRRAAMQCSCAV